MTNPYEPPALPELQESRSISDRIKDSILVLEAITLLVLLLGLAVIDFDDGVTLSTSDFLILVPSVILGLFVLQAVWVKSPWSNWLGVFGVPSTFFVFVIIFGVLEGVLLNSGSRLSIWVLLPLIGSALWIRRSVFLMRQQRMGDSPAALIDD